MSTSTNFMENKVVLNFEDPSIYHDRVLVVGEKKFYVVAGVLSVWSEYFRTMFDGNFSEGGKKEIELKDLEPEVFNTFLKLLYQNNSAIEVDVLIPLIELSYRFLTPMVLELCKDFIDKNFDKLDEIILLLLEAACIHGCQGLKEKMLDHFKDANVSKFSCSEILELAKNHKLDDLKNSMVMHMRDHISCENCSEYLDLCEKFNLPELKEKIELEVNKWIWNTIPSNLIIDLAKSAFKHDLQFLKTKIRYNIFYMADNNHTNRTIRKKNGQTEGRISMTTNWFLLDNQNEIFALPAEISQFIVISTIRDGVN